MHVACQLIISAQNMRRRTVLCFFPFSDKTYLRSAREALTSAVEVALSRMRPVKLADYDKMSSSQRTRASPELPAFFFTQLPTSQTRC